MPPAAPPMRLFLFPLLFPLLSLLLALPPAAEARPEFRARIPNGAAAIIRGSGISCDALGHEQCVPGAPRNPFGLDFAAAGFRWTPALCRMDSDGDGLSNGEELGDPCCRWTPDNPVPLRTVMLSHPGDPAQDGAKLARKCDTTAADPKPKRSPKPDPAPSPSASKPARRRMPRNTPSSTPTAIASAAASRRPRRRRPPSPAPTPSRRPRRNRGPSPSASSSSSPSQPLEPSPMDDEPEVSPSEEPFELGTLPRPVGGCRSRDKRRTAACVCFATLTRVITPPNRGRLLNTCVDLLVSRDNIRELEFTCDQYTNRSGRVNPNRIGRQVDIVGECAADL